MGSPTVTKAVVSGRGPVTVEVSVYSNRVIVWVTDTGPPANPRFDPRSAR
jgi:anti-sigma regulatory factor (Ser/Thr protein kinase)